MQVRITSKLQCQGYGVLWHDPLGAASPGNHLEAGAIRVDDMCMVWADFYNPFILSRDKCTDSVGRRPRSRLSFKPFGEINRVYK